MRRGFTLIELMVAALLMAVLMTILTMVFNQSSISWATGNASVAQFGTTRTQMARLMRQADDMLETTGRLKGMSVRSFWEAQTSGRTVAIPPGLDTQATQYEMRERNGMPRGTISVGTAQTAGSRTYVVGVFSLGPDENDPWDDITTFPEDEK